MAAVKMEQKKAEKTITPEEVKEAKQRLSSRVVAKLHQGNSVIRANYLYSSGGHARFRVNFFNSDYTIRDSGFYHVWEEDGELMIRKSEKTSTGYELLPV